MIYSMTGYGKAEKEINLRKVSVEISSVNHRYLDINLKMPRMLTYLEEDIRGVIKEHIVRGKVDIAITCSSRTEEDMDIEVNGVLAEKYLKAVRTLGDKFGIEDDLRLSDLINIEGIVTIERKVGSLDDMEELIIDTLRTALSSVKDMRRKEGENLRRDLLDKTENMKKLVSNISNFSENLIAQYKEKLLKRIQKLLAEEVSLDENRLEIEAAVLADKSAIDEEIIRLYSHFGQFEDIILSGGPVGRKLDFLMQEMNREANTIGSKSSGSEITKIVVVLKTEIEKIREQIQNLE